MLAARVEPKKGPSKEETKTTGGLAAVTWARLLGSERRMFAEQVELPRVVVMSGCEEVVVTAYFGVVVRLELQGEIHQGVRDVSGSSSETAYSGGFSLRLRGIVVAPGFTLQSRPSCGSSCLR